MADIDILRESTVHLCEYYDARHPEIRQLCHMVKEPDNTDARMRAAEIFLNLLSNGKPITLVPIPSHTGRATYMKEICELMAERNPLLTVCDALSCRARKKTLYELKRTGNSVPTPERLGFRLVDVPHGEVWLLDNVLATGTTMRAALGLLSNAQPCTLAVDSEKI